MPAGLAKGKPVRRILLCAVGLSPQVVTETLYALAVQAPEPWIPDEVHLVSTQEGARRARLTLLHPRSGQFHALVREFGLPPGVRFDDATIHVVTDAEGRPLDDIRMPEDNACAADYIARLVRGLTADPRTELHVSIAGGRKTMGYYLGYLLSLFGRDTDRLSHVLVNEPFESHPEFFFPPRTAAVLYTRDGQPAGTADARVTLAEIPFVRLRDHLPASTLDAASGFGAVVQATQARLDAPGIAIDLGRGIVECGGVRVPMKPQLVAWYAFVAIESKRGSPETAGVQFRASDAGTYLALYARIVGRGSGAYERVAEALKAGFGKNYVMEKNTRVNQALREALGFADAPYRIRPTGRRPLQRYVVSVSAERVEIV